MPEENSLDLVGIGKLAKAVPQKAWVQLVDTACRTFREIVAPITSLTGGFGRLIEAKFDRLVDAEKVLAAEAVKKAHDKVVRSGKATSGKVKINVFIAAVEESALETDPVMRELWANLLAQEMVTAQVHPEFPKILSRLSAADAQLLAQIAEREKDKSTAFRNAIGSLSTNISLLGISINLTELGRNATYIHEHLVGLGLIKHAGAQWTLTLTGKAFIQTVSDSFE